MVISKQAAVNELIAMREHIESRMSVIGCTAYEMAIEALRKTEQPLEIQDILNYLDAVLHPIVSPEHWDVYAELHDMISALPSAQSDIARDIATIIENEKDMRVILDTQTQRWILVAERMPEEDGVYLVTTSKGQVQVHVFNHNGNSEEYWTRCNKAWMPLPEPYREEA